MNSIKSFIIDNLSGFSVKSIPNFLFAFFVAALLSYLLAKLYVKYGNSLSNRASFAANFILLTITTMFIITVVKSSLALSLGLVGALSIVRFRSAIKEPEELMYLFLCISIGLGCGAGLTILTLIAFAGFALVVVLLKKSSQGLSQNLYLTVSGNEPGKVQLDAIVNVLSAHCTTLKLKRSDESGSAFEAAFLVDFHDYASLGKAREELRKLDSGIIISVIDNSRDF
jgi:hypothetical protein